MYTTFLPNYPYIKETFSLEWNNRRIKPTYLTEYDIQVTIPLLKQLIHKYLISDDVFSEILKTLATLNFRNIIDGEYSASRNLYERIYDSSDNGEFKERLYLIQSIINTSITNSDDTSIFKNSLSSLDRICNNTYKSIIESAIGTANDETDVINGLSNLDMKARLRLKGYADLHRQIPIFWMLWYVQRVIHNE